MAVGSRCVVKKMVKVELWEQKDHCSKERQEDGRSDALGRNLLSKHQRATGPGGQGDEVGQREREDGMNKKQKGQCETAQAFTLHLSVEPTHRARSATLCHCDTRRVLSSGDVQGPIARWGLAGSGSQWLPAGAAGLALGACLRRGVAKQPRQWLRATNANKDAICEPQ
mgnify:CR=1 FL=1